MSHRRHNPDVRPRTERQASFPVALVLIENKAMGATSLLALPRTKPEGDSKAEAQVAIVICAFQLADPGSLIA
jgi:hypothetical protein